jgi:hypothetical protein
MLASTESSALKNCAFSVNISAFEIRTVSKIEQRGAAEYDRVTTDAIADLRHP